MIELNFFTLITLSLATSRLAFLFVDEDGPYMMFEKIRSYFGVYDDDFEDVKYNLIAEILSCKWCFSMWAGMFLTLLYLLLPTFTLIIGMALALSMVAIIIANVME